MAGHGHRCTQISDVLTVWPWGKQAMGPVTDIHLASAARVEKVHRSQIRGGWQQITTSSNFQHFDVFAVLDFFSRPCLKDPSSSLLHRLQHSSSATFWSLNLPSGYVKIAIENDHRNSGYAH